MLGYPAACTLTPLPPTAMSAPVIPQTPPQVQAVERCDTKHASRHLMHDTYMFTCPCTKGRVCWRMHTWWRASRHLRSSSRLCTRSQPRTLRLRSQKCRTALKSLCRGWRGESWWITNAESLSAMAPTKTVLSCRAVQLVLVYRVQTKPIMPLGTVLHVEHNGSLSFDECSKIHIITLRWEHLSFCDYCSQMLQWLLSLKKKKWCYICHYVLLWLTTHSLCP